MQQCVHRGIGGGGGGGAEVVVVVVVVVVMEECWEVTFPLPSKPDTFIENPPPVSLIFTPIEILPPDAGGAPPPVVVVIVVC